MNTSIRTYQNIPFLGALCFPCSLTYISCFSFSNNFLFLVAVCNFPWCWCWCAIIDPIFSYNWQYISDSSNFKNVWAHRFLKFFSDLKFEVLALSFNWHGQSWVSDCQFLWMKTFFRFTRAIFGFSNIGCVIMLWLLHSLIIITYIVVLKTCSV